MEDHYNLQDPNEKRRQEAEAAARLQKKNKILTYALAGVAALLLLGGVLYFTQQKKEDKTVTMQQATIAPVVATDSLKVDSARAQTGEPLEGGEGDYYEDPYSENYVIANEAYIRTGPSENAPVTSYRLKFGDRLFIDNSYSGGKYAKVYFERPDKNSAQTPYYVVDYVLTYESDFENFKKYFSLKPFSGLATKTKKMILDNDYSDSRKYHLTQNLERAKSVLSYGDFDQDGIQDVAVIMDQNEAQYSRLLIICTNAATGDPYLAYAENFSDKMRMNSFRKGAKIFMNTVSLVGSPADGVILQAADAKLAVVYDQPNQKFRTYYQEEAEYE